MFLFIIYFAGCNYLVDQFMQFFFLLFLKIVTSKPNSSHNPIKVNLGWNENLVSDASLYYFSHM